MYMHNVDPSKHFIRKPGRLLQPYRRERLKAGAKITWMEIPNGKIYLLNSLGQCFESDATEGVHFSKE